MPLTYLASTPIGSKTLQYWALGEKPEIISPAFLVL
jgi:hypothetical protein